MKECSGIHSMESDCLTGVLSVAGCATGMMAGGGVSLPCFAVCSVFGSSCLAKFDPTGFSSRSATRA